MGTEIIYRPPQTVLKKFDGSWSQVIVQWKAINLIPLNSAALKFAEIYCFNKGNSIPFQVRLESPWIPGHFKGFMFFCGKKLLLSIRFLFWLHVKIKMWFSIIPIYLYNVFSFACFGLCLGKFNMVSKYVQLAVVLFWLWGSASYSLIECVSFNLTCSHAIYFTLTLLEFWIEVKTKILSRHIQYISRPRNRGEW